jgi:hypothetical protein
MRFRPRVEQLESRDTPSTFSPASPVVSFVPAYYPGVPFSALTNPGNDSAFADITGYNASGAAVTNAGVFGAPLV